MNVAAERLLSHLEAVRQTGEHQWVARCPAHDDGRPSLSVKAEDDRVLVHCFAACGAVEIMDALGLGLGDLFDTPPAPRHSTRTKPAISARDALEILARESQIIAIAAGHVADGEPITGQDAERFFEAAGRVRRIRQAYRF